MKTPDYVLMQAYEIQLSGIDTLVLPAGSFVRPIDPYYLPKDIKSKYPCRWYDPKTDFMCYTHYGLLPIAKTAITQV